MDAVGRILVKRIRRVVAENFLIRYPGLRPCRRVCIFVRRRAKNCRFVFLRRVDHLPRLGKRIGERPVDQIGEPGFQIRLVKNVAPGMIVVAARNDSIHLAQHVVEVPHRFAPVHFCEFRGPLRLDFPAVRDAHPSERDLFLRLSRVHQWRPERKQMGIVVNVQTPDSERVTTRRPRLSR